MFAAKLQAGQPLVIEPLALMIETSVQASCSTACKARSVEAPAVVCPEAAENGEGRAKSVGSHRIFSAVLRVACALITLAIAVLARKKVRAIAEFTGSVCYLSMSVTFPLLCYLKLYRQSLSPGAQVLLVAVAMACLYVQAIGAKNAVIGFFA
uniref:Amino acid transporter transmembrane domain-containing protein n=1 Tax=Zooxanthella nutricula TaxID=1333877 RepID=A0A7S2JEJ2_9DINO